MGQALVGGVAQAQARALRKPNWDCELISQIRLKVLPLFPIRNVQYSANCEPGRASPGYTRLTAEVLVPDASPATAAR